MPVGSGISPGRCALLEGEQLGQLTLQDSRFASDRYPSLQHCNGFIHASIPGKQISSNKVGRRHGGAYVHGTSHRVDGFRTIAR